MTRSTRLKAFPISVELLQEMMMEGWTIGDTHIVRCVQGVPSDATFEYVTVWYMDTVALVYSHRSWPIVDVIAGPIPEAHVSYQTVVRESGGVDE